MFCGMRKLYSEEEKQLCNYQRGWERIEVPVAAAISRVGYI